MHYGIGWSGPGSLQQPAEPSPEDARGGPAPPRMEQRDAQPGHAQINRDAVGNGDGEVSAG